MVGLGGLEAELSEDARHVLLDGALGDEELLRDPGVRQALGLESEDLALARRELVVRVPARPGEELGHDLGVERGPAVRDPLERVEEVAHVGHALLQQVATALVSSSSVA